MGSPQQHYLQQAPTSSSSSLPSSPTAAGGGIGIVDPTTLVATSADETLLLTPSGDVLVCRHYDAYYDSDNDDSSDNDDENDGYSNNIYHGQEGGPDSFDMDDELYQYGWGGNNGDTTSARVMNGSIGGGLHESLGRLKMEDAATRGSAHGNANDASHKNADLDSRGPDPTRVLPWDDCCNTIDACHIEPQGLCGGAEQCAEERGGGGVSNLIHNHSSTMENIEHIDTVHKKYSSENNNNNNSNSKSNHHHQTIMQHQDKSALSSPSLSSTLSKNAVENPQSSKIKSINPLSKNDPGISECKKHDLGDDRQFQQKGLKGGNAASSTFSSNEKVATTDNIMTSNNNTARHTPINISDGGEGDNDSLFITSPPHGSITTAKSEDDDEEYDMLDLEGVGLGLSHQDDCFPCSIGRSSSPTPIMSFDYSGYEPPSFDYDGDSMNSYEGMIMNGYGTEAHPINALTNDDIRYEKGSINLPTATTKVTYQKNSLHHHPIRPRSRLNRPRGRHHSVSSSLPKFGDPLFVLPGIPTFLNHLSQMRITRLSAHPRGHHVLLISEEGLLFSYGSNDRGQLGLGKQSLLKTPTSPLQGADLNGSKVTVPSIVTPLLENGGKAINCAAGIDYSLVVVRTEGARIANRRRQQQTQQKGNPGGDSGRNNPSPNNSANEWSAHHQMYGFGNNDHMKLGLLDPHGSRDIRMSNSNGSPRRRRRSGAGGGNNGDRSRSNSPICSSPEVVSPCSFFSSSSADDSSATGSDTSSNDVFLPRRVALHCRVISRKQSSDHQFHSSISHVTSSKSTAASHPPCGIFSVAASIDHSAALVRRPNGAVELYTWGRGEEGALGLPLPTRILEENEMLSNVTSKHQTSPRRWETAPSNGKKQTSQSSYLPGSGSTKMPQKDSPTNQSLDPRHIISSPTLVTSLSFLPTAQKAMHPPLPKSPSRNRTGAPPRSPLKSQHPGRHSGHEHHTSTKNGSNHSIGSTNATQPSNSAAPGEIKCMLYHSEFLLKVALGPSCTHVITSKGRWLAFGSSSDGLLGLGKNVHRVYLPAVIKIPLVAEDNNANTRSCDKNGQQKSDPAEHVSAISVGDKHAVALTNNGNVYTWGRSDHSNSLVESPRRVSFFDGSHGTHAELEMDKKLAYHIRGERMETNSAKMKKSSKPSQKSIEKTYDDELENIDNLDGVTKAAYAHAGHDLSVFVTKSGSVFTCGRQSGRLGQGNVSMDVVSPSPMFGGMQLWRGDSNDCQSFS